MRQPKLLSSPHNPLIKEVRRATLRGSTTESGFCVAETLHLLEEALRSSVEVSAVLVTREAEREAAARLADRPEIEFVKVTDDLFDQLSATETNQGVLTLVKLAEYAPEQLMTGTPLILILDGVQDPGNVGTMLRSAEAFGATGAVLLAGTANRTNPKTLRASAGSLFRLPVLEQRETDEISQWLQSAGITIHATLPSAGVPVSAVNLRTAAALVIGSEGAGVSQAWQAIAQPLRIPTVGVESLNAAAAATVILYETSRQRRELAG